jgi:hypothetical protein
MPPNMQKLLEYKKWGGYLGIVLAFIVPIVLLILSYIRGTGNKAKKGKKEGKR